MTRGEMMDRFNANFYREYGYGFIYPRVFPNHKRESDALRDATVSWGRERARTWLTVLNDHWIGPDNAYVCGNQISIADYFGVAFMTLGEIIRIDFSAYPNIHRWIGNMKQLEHWGEINEALYGFAEAVKDQEFVTV